MKKILGLLMILGLFFVSSGTAFAGLLFDRGLPTVNLNNAAGSDRSNVQWTFGGYAADLYYLPGDDFKIGGSADYLVDTIRVWSTSNTDISMWFGEAGGTLSQLISVPSLTQVKYIDGSDYQGAP